ncbi:MAG: aminodeoxychorismate synthase component I [Bacteroidota bacterium]
MTANQFKARTAQLLTAGQPFFFIVSFDCTQFGVYTFREAYQKDIVFNIKGIHNYTKLLLSKGPLKPLKVEPFPFQSYLHGFEKVMTHLKAGNSFLVNLTFPNAIAAVDLKNLFFEANAPYKLRFQNDFVCFSPECFVKIKDDHIFSYPMKGTIDASLEDAQEQLLNNTKEQQEHHTIVDLIRNDLSRVAKAVTVTKFRYLETIRSATGNILQTSSEIRGKLPKTWKRDFGTLLLELLPAGSISGAPKEKTIKIINEVEHYERGFYTGVFGIFDGTAIDSGVAIRFIQNNQGSYQFKSGGGITHQSNVKEEYLELIKKIHVPTL